MPVTREPKNSGLALSFVRWREGETKTVGGPRRVSVFGAGHDNKTPC